MIAITPPIKRLPGGHEAAKRAGYNARNYMWGVLIHTELDCYAAILAQEVYEWRLKWLTGLALAAPIAAATAWLGRESTETAVLGGLIATIALVVNIRAIPGMTARMELKSHMIETLIAAERYGKNGSDYARSEAGMMAVHYRQFKGWSVDRVLEGMLDYAPSARKWVNRHRNWIAKHAKQGVI